MELIILILLVILLLAILPTWPYSRGWGYMPSGIGLVILIILLIILL
ncbi:MAG: DUF3309 family protein [Candidatus Competibacteraceae bacterium]|nr:DUF3309 family protein [Candidatus Competibacteraceae bacterium]